MAKLVEMDERASIFAQMDKEDNVKGSVILINKFSIAHNEIVQFLKGWETEAEEFKQQPGYISTQLHRGIGESSTFINYAVWESVAHFKKAVSNVIDPKNSVSAFPPGTTVSPHLFKKVAVSGLCVE
jgi:quinol monooxygenase YgiN